ncbi:MAG: 50S ribosomal protein L25 [Verrucomicrobiota bacterium]
MAKHLTLNAQTRLTTGRTAVKKIKAQGLVPAVVYGGHVESINLTINAREIGKLLGQTTSEHVLVDLTIETATGPANRLALIQKVQHDAITQKILHVDFHAVKEDEKLHSSIPVETVGEPSGVKNYGGILEINMHSIEIECLPKDLPEIITIDVSNLGVGDAIHIKDLQLPEGVSTRTDGELTVVRVSASKVEVVVAGAEKEETAGKGKGGKGGAKAAAAKAPAKPADKK